MLRSIRTFLALLSLSLMLTAIPSVSDAAPVQQNGNCWCTQYIYNRFLLDDNTYGNANTWGSYLERQGFQEAATARSGQVVVFSETAGLGPAGHIGIIVSVNQDQTLTVRGANQENVSPGDTGPTEEYDCNNVYTTKYSSTASSHTTFYERPIAYKIRTPLRLSNTSPRVGNSVTASFTLRNVGTSAIQIQELAAGVRLGRDWNGQAFDFPHATNITLSAGEEYTYTKSRTFTVEGNYFAEQVIRINNKWGGIKGANRILFSVGR